MLIVKHTFDALNCKGYTYAGLYEVIYVDENYDTVCYDCIKKHEFYAIGQFIHFEGEPLFCVSCNDLLESEYGEIDDD